MRWQRLIPRIVIGGPIALIIVGLVYHGGAAPQGGYLRHSHRMIETSGTLNSDNGVDSRRH
jgi:hypothetical protein